MDFLAFSHNKKTLYDELKNYRKRNKKLNFGKSYVKERDDSEMILIDREVDSVPDLVFYQELKEKRNFFQLRLDKIKNQLKKRIKNTFSTSTAQDRDLEISLDECYNFVKEYESIVSKITIEIKNQTNKALLMQGIKAHFSNVLKKMVKDLKKEEQKFFTKVKSVDPSIKNSNFDFINDNYFDESKRVIFGDKGETMLVSEISLKDQNQDVKNMFETITKLSKILHEISEITFEQGVIVDRVDYNVELALVRTRKGNSELVKAKDNLESGCFARLIRFLIIGNIMIFLLIILKFK